MTPGPAPRLNVYFCRSCEGATVTVDLDEGTTPFLIGCRAETTPGGSRRRERCQGTAESRMYRVSQLWLAHVSHAWVKPADPDNINPREYDHGDWPVDGLAGMREWVKGGRLLLRKLTQEERYRLRKQGEAAHNAVLEQVDLPAEDRAAIMESRAAASRRDPADFDREMASLGLGRTSRGLKPTRPARPKDVEARREIRDLQHASDPWRQRGGS